MGPDAAMEILGQLSQSLERIAENNLRSLKHFSRIQRIRKLLFAESHKESCLAVLIHPRLALESSAVYKGHPVAGPCIFRSLMVRRNYRRIILMAGSPPEASDL